MGLYLDHSLSVRYVPHLGPSNSTARGQVILTTSSFRSMSAFEWDRLSAALGANGGSGEGFLMRVAAYRCALARQRPALENLPRWKPRGSWIDLWGKSAVGWGDGCFRGSAEGAHDG